MKRDMDLVRDILLAVEDLPFDGRFHEIDVDRRSQNEISYHVMLLHKAGLLEAIDLSTHDGVCWRPKTLTYMGHEFIDAARSDNVWSKAKSLLLSTTGTLTIEGLKSALPIVVQRLLAGN